MKDKQNSNIETQEIDEEDNLEFFYFDGLLKIIQIFLLGFVLGF